MDKYTCKRCGGTIEIEKGKSVGICDSCGRPQNVPREQSDEITKMYNQADRLRRVEKDYDAAKKVYEEILNNDPDEPEANWGVVLCQYGIQYANDPLTEQLVPTLNRMQNVSVFDNPFFKKAIENSGDPENYQKDAQIIENILKGYQQVAATEKPYDVFISYKDRIDGTDQKTEDYEVAKKIYEVLVDKGLRVFFSDRSLKGKAVGDYEPYIYSALESACFMLVVGSKTEYFNAEWVRNEWSRYMQRIREGANKRIVPVYHDCSISEIPIELTAKNQAYDYNDIGAMSGLFGIIERDCERAKQISTGSVVATATSANSANDSLKQRIFIALNSGDWNAAVGLTNKLFESEPTYAEGYLALIMAERNCCDRRDLGKGISPLKNSKHYRNLMQFADDALTMEIQKYETEISANIKKFQEEKDAQKKKALRTRLIIALAAAGVFLVLILTGTVYFKFIRPAQKVKEAKELIAAGQTDEGYAILEKLGKGDMIIASKYDIAKDALENENYNTAYALFSEIGDYKDAAELMNESKFTRGKAFLDSGDYDSAYELLGQIGSYQDADTLIADSKYERAGKYVQNAEYNDAITLYDELGEYKDSKNKAEEARRALLEIALASEDYLTAYDLYLDLGDSDSASALAEEHKWVEIATAQPGDTVFFGHYEQDNDNSNGKEDVEWIVLDVQEDKVLLLTKYYIEKQPFNTGHSDAMNWEISSLRYWMKEEMVGNLFDEDEMSRVLLSNVSSEIVNAPNETTRHNGNDTEDYLFLLSFDEYLQYRTLIPNTDRTTYALAEPQNSIYVDLESSFWLRTMQTGDYPYRVSTEFEGPGGGWGCECTAGIRPAIWFNLGNGSVQTADTEEAKSAAE
ncbi:MAG: toll/interleukin-1 receptor domain-containing protein [Lachnospiraceae bacterium]|nr:toll/interleukin-1 receptor domain-containing protein [Lachnospiraceae bacterium]